MIVKSKPITLNDVARRAGVSYQTVSRVINDHPNVAEVTRKRVLRAIRELGYRPNRAARSLVTRRSQTVGIISYGTRYYGPAQMLVNIEAALRAKGYGLTLATVEALSREALEQATRELLDHNVDGLVMITPLADIDMPGVVALCAGTPFVMIDVDPGERIPSVAIDQRLGARLAAEHLIALGHRAIAEISGPLSWNDARLRHEGHLAALSAAGLAPLASVQGDWSAASGYRAMQQLLTQAPELTAVVAGNDQMALGALRALREAGRAVPAQVSVIGFDDIPEAAYFAPPLSTIRQDFSALGQQSADYLLSLIAAPQTPAHQRLLAPELIVRHSTAAAPQ